MPQGERLQKLLARAGLGSRRACEELLRQGRVTVNGEVARLGQSADPATDLIAVDGRPLAARAQPRYVVLHKPAGVVCTVHDPQGRATVLDLVQAPGRLYPVGRLDYDSEGLLLLTDDGELAYRLTHPRYEVEKEYHVLVQGRPDAVALRRWRQGRVLAGERPAPARVEELRPEGDDTWLRVVIHEGRKRQVRLTAEALGHPVRRLVRVRLDGLRLGNLAAGQWRALSAAEVETLRHAVGLGEADEARGRGGEGATR